MDRFSLLLVEIQTQTDQCCCSLAKTSLCASYIRDASICVFEYVLAV